MKYCVYEVYKKEYPQHNYIGKTYVDNVSCSGYLGSGNIITKAVSKHGKNAFDIRIIKRFDSEQDAYDYEEKLIRENKPYYNADGGGRGVGSGKFHPMFGKKHTEEAKRKRARFGKENHMYGRKRPDLAENNRKRHSYIDPAYLYSLRVDKDLTWDEIGKIVNRSRGRCCHLAKEYAKENNLSLEWYRPSRTRQRK